MASADTHHMSAYGSLLLLPLNRDGGLDPIKHSIADF